MCIVCSVVSVMYDKNDNDEYERGEGENRCHHISLLLSTSTKGTARFFISDRRNYYQQIYMPAQHSHFGGVRNLTQVNLVYNLIIRSCTPPLLA